MSRMLNKLHHVSLKTISNTASKLTYLSLKTGFELYTYCAPFYVGLMDGQGTPIGPALKYALLASPTALVTAATGLSSYSVYKLRKLYNKNPINSKTKQITDANTDDAIDELVKRGEDITDILGIRTLEKIANMSYIPNEQTPLEHVAKSAAGTATKTVLAYGIGYIAGSLSKAAWTQ